jgi:hypothetical protein
VLKRLQSPGLRQGQSVRNARKKNKSFWDGKSPNSRRPDKASVKAPVQQIEQLEVKPQ